MAQQPASPPSSSQSFSRINGQPASELAVLDRGFMYGDGVFRTLRVETGKPLWWDEQIARLHADAGHLNIPVPALTAWLADAQNLPVADGILRLTLSRGVGPRGYRLPETPVPTRVVQFFPGVLPARTEAAGINLRVCDLRLAEQPRLAGIKHLNRLEQVLARGEWNDPGIAEGLLGDVSGCLVSGVASNVFLIQGRRLLTPRLERCGVLGAMRARVIQRAPSLGYQVEEVDVHLDALARVEGLLLTNSVFGLRWAAHLQGPATRTWRKPADFAALQEVTWAA